MRLPHAIMGVAKLEKCLILRQTHVMRLYGNNKNNEPHRNLSAGLVLTITTQGTSTNNMPFYL